MTASMKVTAREVLEIRAEYDAGTIVTKRWADKLNCSIESVRRIARRETYRFIAEVDAAAAVADEVAADEAAASLRRLQAELDATPMSGREADALITELTKQGERNRDDPQQG